MNGSGLILYADLRMNYRIFLAGLGVRAVLRHRLRRLSGLAHVAPQPGAGAQGSLAMIRHVFKLIWHRKRTNLLLMAEIFFSVLVLFGVGCARRLHGRELAAPDRLHARQPVGRERRHARDGQRHVHRVAGRDDAARAARPRGSCRRSRTSPARCCRRTSWAASNRAYNREGRRVEFGVNEVTDEFKDVLGLQIVQGRWFGREDDGASYLPVVINAADGRASFSRARTRSGRTSRPSAHAGRERRAGSPTGPGHAGAARRGRASRPTAKTARSTGRRAQALYRKPLVDTDPSEAREPAAGQPDPADAAGDDRQRFEEPLAEAPAGRGAGVVVRGQADDRDRGRR